MPTPPKCFPEWSIPLEAKLGFWARVYLALRGMFRLLVYFSHVCGLALILVIALLYFIDVGIEVQDIEWY
jgi:hypothetical protein